MKSKINTNFKAAANPQIKVRISRRKNKVKNMALRSHLPQAPSPAYHVDLKQTVESDISSTKYFLLFFDLTSRE